MTKSMKAMEPRYCHAFTWILGTVYSHVQSRFAILLVIACLASIIIGIMPMILHAQTEGKDRGISMARENQVNPSIAYPTRTDITTTVWEDERDPQNGKDIFIAAFDNFTGTNLWVWDAYLPDVVKDRYDGVAVCRAEFDQRNPRAAYDGMGGVIVTWEDFRNDPFMVIADIYAMRIDLATGQPDPNWPIDGIPVCQTGFHAERPRIVGTVDGAFITWIDYRNDPGFPPYNRDVFVQYIQGATATWPPTPTNWVQNGIPVPTNTNPDQLNPELDTDNILVLDLLGNMTQGVVVTYQDDRYNGAYSGQSVWTVFANRIDANGVQMYTVGPPPWRADIPVSPSYEHQEYPRIVTTGKVPNVTTPSAIIVWQDMIDNPAAGWTDIMVQRLDAVGNPMFPGPTGLPVCQFPMPQTFPQPTLWESGDPLLGTDIPYVTVGWWDARNGSPAGVDLYAGLIMANAPGQMVNPAGPAGDPICTLQVGKYDLSMDNLLYNSQTNESTVFAWSHDSPQGRDIRCQKIDLVTWVASWPIGGWPVTEAKQDQVLPQVNREVFVWQDGRRDPIAYDSQDDENILAQTPGTCTGGTEMLWRDEFAKWTRGEDARDFRFVADPEDGSTFVTWDEVRYPFAPGDPYRIVFVQKLDKDGVIRWATNGVAVSRYACGDDYCSQEAQLPDLCLDGAGGVRMVWQQTEGAYQACRAAQVTPDGIPAYYGDGQNWAQPTPGQAFNHTEPRIVRETGGNAVALWGVIQQIAAGIKSPVLGAWIKPTPLLDLFPKSILNVGQSMINDHTDLRIVSDRFVSPGEVYPGLYSLTRSAGGNRLSIMHCNIGELDPLKLFFVMNETVTYSAFGGYGLTNIFTTKSGRSPAMFTWSESPGVSQPFEIHLGAFDRMTRFTRTPITNNAGIPSPPQPPDSKLPVLVGDSLFPSGNKHEGVLLAWDTQIYSAGGSSTYQVHSDRYRISSITPNLVATPEFGTIVLDAGLSAPSHPDIARVVNSIPGAGPYGVVVWEGGGETSPCFPARATDIMGQYVLYDANSSNGGAQWSGPQMIAPGPGTYHQLGPQVQPGLNGEVSVYWYDGQTGEACVMGTRLPALGSAIHWAKAVRRDDTSMPTPGFRIESIWPQPATTGSDAVNILVNGLGSETMIAEIHDMLGRRRAVLHDGIVSGSSIILSLSPSARGLTGGTYLLRIRHGGVVVTRKFTVIR